MVDVFMAFGAGFRVMYVPTAGREEDELSRLSAFLYDIQGNYHRHQTKITLVADEVHLGFPQPARVVPHGFATLCTRGRHRGINLVGITQRTAQVNPAFRGNLEYAYFFRHGDALDIGKACQQLGAQWRGALQGLKNFECLAQHDGVVNKIICKK
ncbi:hypothetical protein FACS1894186_7490 [Alphaproteobacteria bacterium]|nr:hypothetical protein FACS1894186_7490 [Alphaproteobacteria bacterium]